MVLALLLATFNISHVCARTLTFHRMNETIEKMKLSQADIVLFQNTVCFLICACIVLINLRHFVNLSGVEHKGSGKKDKKQMFCVFVVIFYK